MAKKDKAPKADTKGTEAKADKAEKTEKTPEFKFGVSDLAEQLGIKDASVRVQLRNKGIAKAGKSYGWNTMAELKEVAGQLKSTEDGDGAKKKAKKSEKVEAAAEPAEKPKKDKKDKKAKKGE